MIMSNRKRKRGIQNVNPQRCEIVDQLTKEADKTKPYPERINVIKDHLRSDLYCLEISGYAYMTVSKNADRNTVTYIREDLFPKDNNNSEKIDINKLKEEILIQKDRVESLQAARTAVILTVMNRLKKLMMKTVIMFGATALVLFSLGYYLQRILAFPLNICVWILLWCLSFEQAIPLFKKEIKYWKSKI